jgi:hypothetical protein
MAFSSFSQIGNMMEMEANAIIELIYGSLISLITKIFFRSLTISS